MPPCNLLIDISTAADSPAHRYINKCILFKKNSVRLMCRLNTNDIL